MNNNFQLYSFNHMISIRDGFYSYQFSLKIVLILIASLIVNQSEAAPTIFLNAPDRIAAGKNFKVNVGISGLDPADDLGAFSFDFFFTKDIANFLPLTSSFGDQLGDPTNPLDTFIGVDVSDIGINQKLEIFEVSLLPDLSGQLDDFTLFTVGLFTPRFTGPANKSLGVTANNFVLSDAFGNEITATNTSVGKGIVVVPEPPLSALMIFGLIAFKSTSEIYKRKRNKVTEYKY